jgi:hypothetical protein
VKYLFAFEGYAIANLTVRLNCDPSTINQQIDKRWLQEDLSEAIERLLKRLYENTQQAKTFNQLSIARLDYCLPLFKVFFSEKNFQIKFDFFSFRILFIIPNVRMNGLHQYLISVENISPQFQQLMPM